MFGVLRLPAGRSGLLPLRHGGELSGTLAGALIRLIEAFSKLVMRCIVTYLY